MTQRDKWAKRPAVLRYRAWADRARAAAPPDLPQLPNRVDWVAFVEIPKSYSKKKRAEITNKACREKPDRDNIDKAILDVLWENDKVISCGWIEKRWDDGNGPRVVVTIWEDDDEAPIEL